MSVMTLEAVDGTTAPFIKYPEIGIKVYGAVNETESVEKRRMKAEYYPVRFGLPGMRVSAKKAREWEGRYGVEPVRVHLPWMYNYREIAYQMLAADWFGGSLIDPRSLPYRIEQSLAMVAVGPSTNNYGIKMAQELGVGVKVNIHPNVLAGYVAEGKLDELKAQVPYILGENSISFNALYERDRAVLGDPRATVRDNVKAYGLQGMLLAIDHLFGINKNDDPEFIKSRVKHIAEILTDPDIQEYTEVMHIASPGHGRPEIGNPTIEQMLKDIAQTPFKRPIRMALDIHPNEVKKMSEAEQIDYFKGMRMWIFETIDKYN